MRPASSLCMGSTGTEIARNSAALFWCSCLWFLLSACLLVSPAPHTIYLCQCPRREGQITDGISHFSGFRREPMGQVFRCICYNQRHQLLHTVRHGLPSQQHPRPVAKSFLLRGAHGHWRNRRHRWRFYVSGAGPTEVSTGLSELHGLQHPRDGLGCWPDSLFQEEEPTG